MIKHTYTHTKKSCFLFLNTEKHPLDLINSDFALTHETIMPA